MILFILCYLDIVKTNSGSRYVVGVRVKLDMNKLTVGVRVSLDITTLTIMKILPREVDPVVFNMLNEGNNLRERGEGGRQKWTKRIE